MTNDFLADVQRYDRRADADTIQKIVRHLGIALQGRDGSQVSCGDSSELSRIRDDWCARKLGETDKSKCDEAIAKVCEEMAGDRSKQRVTFYYLVARQLEKLGSL